MSVVISPNVTVALLVVDDPDILPAVAAGDSRAIVRLYRQHAAALYSFIARRVQGPAEDVEEILQDTMLAAVRGAAHFRGDCGARTWLCSIARNQILQRQRSELRKKRVPASCTVHLDEEAMDALRSASDGSGSLTEDLLESLAARELVSAVLRELDSAYREVLLLRYVDDFSVKEIARIWNKSERSVEGLIRRALERSREIGKRYLG